MPDPIEELDNFTSPGLTMNPMPAAEVRRRGTRMRRRNTALATVGGIAAVAVIAAPFAVFAGQGDQRDLEPAPAVWHQTIPDDFDLAAGMPNGTKPSNDGVGAIAACGLTLWAPGNPGPVDVEGVSYAGDDSSDTQDRSLAVYGDDDAAKEAFATLHDGLVDCPTQKVGSGATVVNDVREDDLGTDASFVFTNQVQDGDLLSDLTTFEVARSGNALFLASSHTSAGGPQVVEGEIQRLEDASASVIDQLCVFSAEGCGDSSTAVDPGSDSDVAATVIPDGFDLLAGLPTEGATKDFGRVGPDRDLDPIKLDACGTAGPKPDSIDRLRGGFTGPEGERQRQLMTFADEDAAQAYVDDVASLFPCTEDGGNGVTGYNERRDVDLGDSAVAGFLHFIVDGEPGPGYEIVHAVRVGQAVLLSRITVDGENTVITDEVQAELLDETAAQLTDVVADMCTFSDDGC